MTWGWLKDDLRSTLDTLAACSILHEVSNDTATYCSIFLNEAHNQSFFKIHTYVIFSCQLAINQCLISCSNMIWTFRIFFTLLFALCVEAQFRQFNFPREIHRPKVDPQKVHSKKVPVNNKKGKYLLGSVFCWIMSILFTKEVIPNWKPYRNAGQRLCVYLARVQL